jgi:hypothetical protein
MIGSWWKMRLRKSFTLSVFHTIQAGQLHLAYLESGCAGFAKAVVHIW